MFKSYGRPRAVLADGSIKIEMVCMTKEDMVYSSEIGDQDFSRLEFLSACVIMKDEYTAHHLLPRVPHSFYPALFQAVMQKCYYSTSQQWQLSLKDLCASWTLLVSLFRYRMSTCWRDLSEWHTTPIVHLIISEETECLELELCGLCNNSLLPLLCIPKSLTSLSLAHNRNITSLQFLSQLPCLCELNISGINVRDKCEPIGSLPQGLQYLKLVGCRVRSADLQVLITSKHVLTLRHLDLSENPLGGPEDFYSLCKLCQKLQKVSVLEVENCNLNTVIPELLTQLINILTQMPTLAFLRLNRNDFSSWSITKHIVCLGYSRTMRCLCMTVPSEVYISDDYTVIDKRIKKLCTDFLSSLQAMNATHVAVEWIEESLYSRWFHTI
ncbi:uncharacterized protein [Cherax quadricarinatus]|uniref:uncharacterized protein isoform X2 n=1 Tax=Cherax quadricarinatus TaxID=27406 RepID=UPI00387E5CED